MKFSSAVNFHIQELIHALKTTGKSLIIDLIAICHIGTYSLQTLEQPHLDQSVLRAVFTLQFITAPVFPFDCQL